MARTGPSDGPEGRGGGLVLLLAWAVVLGLSGGAAGYLALYGDETAPRTSRALVLNVPAPEPSAEPEPEAAEATPAEPKPVATEAQPEPEPEAAESEPPEPAGEAAAETPAPEEATASAVYHGPPRIAVVVTGLGLASEASGQAIAQLPPEVTLSFSPYSDALDQWIPKARAGGHEVMVDLPMEPETFPLDDPGPQALLTNLPQEQNLERLRWVLTRGRESIGVAAHMGSRFVSSSPDLRPVLTELKARGILFLDNGASPDSVGARLAGELALPYAVTDRVLDDDEPSREAISARLVQVERLALTNGSAIAMGRPYPATLERLGEWAAGLGARGFALAPISELARVPGQQ
ncbi:MAG: divergent polysaccharide deacetylase family protein [Rhodospirillales bacterium]|nr:divergent polysaccharide deacetylase family protein [Rhodospirillales bacterium]